MLGVGRCTSKKFKLLNDWPPYRIVLTIQIDGSNRKITVDMSVGNRCFGIKKHALAVPSAVEPS